MATRASRGHGNQSYSVGAVVLTNSIMIVIRAKRGHGALQS